MTGAMDGMIKGGTVLLPKVPKYLPRAAGRNGTVPGRRCGSLDRTTARSDPHPEATCLMENWNKGTIHANAVPAPAPHGGILARQQYGIPARVVARLHAPPRPLPHPACNAAHSGTGRSSVVAPGTVLPFETMRHSGSGTSRSSATVPARAFLSKNHRSVQPVVSLPMRAGRTRDIPNLFEKHYTRPKGSAASTRTRDRTPRPSCSA